MIRDLTALADPLSLRMCLKLKRLNETYVVHRIKGFCRSEAIGSFLLFTSLFVCFLGLFSPNRLRIELKRILSSQEKVSVSLSSGVQFCDLCMEMFSSFDGGEFD